jgi:hypothetical protein
MLLSKTLNNLSFWIASEIPRNDVQPLGFASLRGGALSAVEMSEQSRKSIYLYLFNNTYFRNKIPVKCKRRGINRKCENMFHLPALKTAENIFIKKLPPKALIY